MYCIYIYHYVLLLNAKYRGKCPNTSINFSIVAIISPELLFWSIYFINFILEPNKYLNLTAICR